MLDILNMYRYLIIIDVVLSISYEKRIPRSHNLNRVSGPQKNAINSKYFDIVRLRYR